MQAPAIQLVPGTRRARRGRFILVKEEERILDRRDSNCVGAIHKKATPYYRGAPH